MSRKISIASVLLLSSCLMPPTTTDGAATGEAIARRPFVGKMQAADYQTDAVRQFRTPSLYALPEGYGPGFELSIGYPTVLAQESYPWEPIDFRSQPEAYLRSVLDYVLEGNVQADWDLRQNKVRGWYHAPWMHAGRRGREPVHGLTSERGSRPFELHVQQSRAARNWAVGFYNAPGGYTLGKVWADPARPDTSNVQFPVGTVSAKLLFTNASETQVPYLRGAKVWQAQIDRDQKPVPMRLLQLDIAVRDRRADSTTGWVFGTFLYNADRPGNSVWEKLEPVGLQWGNDPLRRLADYDQKRPLSEGWVNPSVEKMFTALPRKWLGLWGRTNGPVDNPNTTCAACHGRAMDLGYRQVDVPFEPDTTDEQSLMQYFKNRKPNEPFFPGFRSLDYSLQLSDGLANFRQWVGTSYPAYKDYVYGPEERLQSGLFSTMKGRSAGPVRGNTIKEFETPFVRGETVN